MEIESEFNNLKSLLEKDYVMIKKGKLWSFLGGAIALLVAAGFVNQGMRFDLMRLIVWEFADLTSANDGRIII